MAVQYPFGFEIGNNEPIDTRFTFTDLAARDSLLSINRYEGLISYVVAEGEHYRLKGGIENSNWEPLGSGGGSSSSDSSIYANIANDVSIASPLLSEEFTNAFYAGVSFEYQIVRESSTNGRKVVKGSFTRIYNADGTDTFKSGDKLGDTTDIGISFELNPTTGLIEYTSTEFLGTGYEGFIKIYNLQRLSLVIGGDGVFQSAPIENNVTAPTTVISNLFPASSHVGVMFTALIHREVDGLEYNSLVTRSVVYTTSGAKEEGTRVGDNAGVTFTLDQASGELRYTSTEMVETSSEYVGFINFYRLIPLKVSAGPTSSTSVSLPSSLTGSVELSDIYTDPDDDGADTMILADIRKLVRVDTSINGAFNFIVPAFMNSRGAILTIMDVGGDLIEEPLTVTFSGGATIVGAPSVQLNTPNISYRFVYMDDLNDWRVMEGTGLGVNVLNGVPTGAIIPFGGTIAPVGYTLADGAEVSRTDPLYQELFSVYGTTWGAGDGTTTFNKPKLNGRTLRFVDDGAGVDPDAALRTALFAGGNTGDNVGSYQNDEVKSHSHTGTTLNVFNRPFLNASGQERAVTTQSGIPIQLQINSSPAGGNESRMKNANVYALIKL